MELAGKLYGELCGEIPVYICDMNGWVKTVSSSGLIPDAFDEKDLK